MRGWSRLVTFLLVTLVAFWFTVENASESVSVDLVLFRVSAPLPLVVFVAMLIGMLAVLGVGLRADLHTRRMLQRYREVMEGEDPTRGVGLSAGDPFARDATASKTEPISSPTPRS